MNLDALRLRTTELATAIRSEIRREVERTAQDGLTMVTQRVSETGKDAQGSSFPSYTKPYELYKRGAVGTAKKEGKKKRAARGTAVASGENPVGRFTGFRNFTLSGQMLSSIGITEVQESRKIVVRVGGRDEFTRDKMEGNENVTPGWFRLSQSEIKRLGAQSEKRMGAFAQKFITG